MYFLNNWLYIIRNCNYDNSYKVAWAKAITEISLDLDYNTILAEVDQDENKKVEISLTQIAEKVIRYYWEQTIFFNLQQSPNSIKPPKIVSVVKGLISDYQVEKRSNQPVKWYRSNVEVICKEQYQKAIKKIIEALKADVSYRFLRVEGNVIEGIYDYTQKSDKLYLDLDNLKQLKENSVIVFDAINYKWTQMLENFNHSPRISKKVKIIDEENVRRKPLTKFASYLDAENPDHICFICGKMIADESIAVDHVIPWSYLYSDDLWNLVYAHQRCNSSKSNVIPSEEIIQRLELRNTKMMDVFLLNGLKNKHISELEMANENRLVRKFWIGCQG
jgi:hypothetical protein